MLSKVKSFLQQRQTKNSSEKLLNKIDHRNLKSFSSDSQEFNCCSKEENEEDISILYFSNDLTRQNEHQFIRSLRSINNSIQAFRDEKELLTTIQSISDEKVILIVNYLTEDFAKNLQKFSAIDTVIFFRRDSIENGSYPFRLVQSNVEELMENLSEIHRSLTKRLVKFSVFDRNQSIEHSGSFLFYQLLKMIFKKFSTNSESKKIFVSKAKIFYRENEKMLDEIAKFDVHYKSSKALSWYRTNSFLSRLMNKALRTENPVALYNLHFFIKDLSTQIENDFQKSKKRNSKRIYQFYFPYQTTKNEMTHFQSHVGNLILTNGFLLVNDQREKVFQFLTRDSFQSDDHQRVLIEFHIDLTLVNNFFFAPLNENENENENDSSQDNGQFLFDFANPMKIVSCLFNENEKIWLMKVNATEEGLNFLSEYLQYRSIQMSQSNLMLTFGQLFIQVAFYDKAQNYFQTILNSFHPNEEEISCIHFQLGRIYRLKNDHENALKHLNQSFLLHLNDRPKRLLSAAKAMNSIAILYVNQGNVQQAIQSFETVLKLYSKTVENDHPDLGGTFINLANIYSEQNQFDLALTFFQRAQQIFERHFPSNHPNQAILFNNLANLFYRQEKFHLALDAHQKALQINENIFSPQHPQIIQSKQKISIIENLLRNQDQSIINSSQEEQ